MVLLKIFPLWCPLGRGTCDRMSPHGPDPVRERFAILLVSEASQEGTATHLSPVLALAPIMLCLREGYLSAAVSAVRCDCPRSFPPRYF